MDSILNLGLDIIKFIQQFQSSGLTTFFKIITFLGDEYFYLILFPFILWSVDFKRGAKLGFIFLVSVCLNMLLKDFIQQPRPFIMISGINLINEAGFGLPSGHAQNSIVIWGIISSWLKNKPFKGFMFLLIVLIGLSRIYLGVHFPSDILGGWIVGGVLLIFYFNYMDKISTWIDGLTPIRQIALIPIFPILLTLVHPEKEFVNIMGIVTGVGIGLVLFYRYYEFEFDGNLFKRILRFCLGIIITVPIYFGFKYLRPETSSPIFIPVYFLIKVIFGVWISFGAPWLFIKTKLISAKKHYSINSVNGIENR